MHNGNNKSVKESVFIYQLVKITKQLPTERQFLPNQYQYQACFATQIPNFGCEIG